MHNAIYGKEILNSSEAAQFLGIKKSYLFKLTHYNILKFYKPNGKLIFFKREDLEKWLLGNPNRTIQEQDVQSSNYVTSI